MSVFNFLASNQPMEDVINPYIENISINEAIQRGISVPDLFMGDSVDKDKKIMIYCESEDKMNALKISKYLYYSEEEAFYYTKKHYLAHLHNPEFVDNKESLIAYIINHLEVAEEIELWSIWLELYEVADVKEVKLSDLKREDLSIYDGGYEKPRCLVVRK